AHHLQGAGDRRPELVLPQGEPVLGRLEPILEPLDLGLQALLALAGGLQLLLDDHPVLRIRVRRFQLPGECGDVAVRIPSLRVLASRLSITWERLPSSRLIVSVFLTRTSRIRSSLRSV